MKPILWAKHHNKFFHEPRYSLSFEMGRWSGLTISIHYFELRIGIQKTRRKES